MGQRAGVTEERLEAGVGQGRWGQDREYPEKLDGRFSQVQRPASPVASRGSQSRKLSSCLNTDSQLAASACLALNHQDTRERSQNEDTEA